jgi:preprotein translocase subunit SecB
MADETNGKPAGNGPAAAPAAQPQPQAQPRLQILTQFIRDLSFENIAAQKGAAADGKPEIKVQVNLDAQKRADDQYEVALKLKIDSRVGETAIFLMELDYAGRFVIQNVPAEQLHPLLMIECPRLIFPFVRRIVSDVTRDGGFPPINLDTIDFLALYRQELARRQQQQAAAQSGQPQQA